jgi:hypothetical protein
LLNNDTANTINVDGCAASLINRIDTFHASNPLESIIQYNVLYNFLMDFQTNSAQKLACSNHMGFSSTIVNSVTIPALPITSSIAGAAYAGIAVGGAIGTSAATAATAISNLGLRDGAQLQVAPAAGTPSRLTFCLPVLSGVWGMLLDKMLPVGALNDDIRIEITWEQQLLGVVYNTYANAATAWSITGVELELCYVELADDSMHIVNEVSPLNGDLYLHGKSYRHYVSTMPVNTSGQFSTLVPQRFASTCGLIVLPRRSTEISGTLYTNCYSIGSRINPNIDSYWLRLGSLVVPQKNIILRSSSGIVGSFTEAFYEIQKFFHSTNHPEMSGSIPFSYYNKTDAINATTPTIDTAVGMGGVTAPGLAYNAGQSAGNLALALATYNQAFALALNLETYSQRSDVIISGVNTLSQQTFFECNITTPTTTTYTIDFYALFDQILIKDQNGILSVRF